MEDIIVMGIESSCDETSVAIVKNGREVLSNVINSQIDIHTEFGGVVPEIASRCHTEVINQVMKKALKDAGITLNDVDGIAVTQGPGLVGALLVGVSYAKALSFASRKAFNCSKPYKWSYCGKLYNTQRLKTTIFMFDNFWWTYKFGKCNRLQ